MVNRLGDAGATESDLKLLPFFRSTISKVAIPTFLPSGFKVSVTDTFVEEQPAKKIKEETKKRAFIKL